MNEQTTQPLGYIQCPGMNSLTGTRCVGRARNRSGLCALCYDRKGSGYSKFVIHPSAKEPT